jgi:hypothetical protein
VLELIIKGKDSKALGGLTSKDIQQALLTPAIVSSRNEIGEF